MNEPSFLSVAQRDRREEHRCPEGATERCERDFLRLPPCVGNSNAIRIVLPQRNTYGLRITPYSPMRVAFRANLPG
jgi:hypothetical protein